MKHRTLLSNICSIVVVAALVLALLAYSGVIGGSRDSKAAKTIYYISIPIAVIAVALFDIILPAVDNRKHLKEPKYLLKVIVKSVLFAAAMVIIGLVLYAQLGQKMNEFLALGIFAVLYIAQFFINLDPKPVRKSSAEKVVLNEKKDDTEEE